MTIIIFSWFSPSISALKLKIFKTKLLVTFNLIAADKLSAHILNHPILLFTMSTCEKFDGPSLLPHINPYNSCASRPRWCRAMA